jgi:hypothetical protein
MSSFPGKARIASIVSLACRSDLVLGSRIRFSTSISLLPLVKASRPHSACSILGVITKSIRRFGSGEGRSGVSLPPFETTTGTFYRKIPRELCQDAIVRKIENEPLLFSQFYGIDEIRVLICALDRRDLRGELRVRGCW